MCWLPAFAVYSPIGPWRVQCRLPVFDHAHPNSRNIGVVTQLRVDAFSVPAGDFHFWQQHGQHRLEEDLDKDPALRERGDSYVAWRTITRMLFTCQKRLHKSMQEMVLYLLELDEKYTTHSEMNQPQYSPKKLPNSIKPLITVRVRFSIPNTNPK